MKTLVGLASVLAITIAAAACGASPAGSKECAANAVASTGGATRAAAPPQGADANGDGDGDDATPPATPVEMPPGQPGPNEQESATIWGEAVARARDAPLHTLKCLEVVSSTTRLAFANAPPAQEDVKKELKAYLRIARCAEKLESFGFMRQLALAMMRAAPDDSHPELLARALMGRRRFDAAEKSLEASRKRKPDDVNLAMASARLDCLLARWAKCKIGAERTLELAAKLPDEDEQRRMVAGAHKYLARSLVRTGPLDDAVKSLDEAERLHGKWIDIQDIRDEIAMARTFGSIVDLQVDDEFALGVYHLSGKLDGVAPLLRVNLDNVSASETRYRVEAVIDGTTQSEIQTVTLKASASRYIELQPVLRADFDVNSVRAPTPTNVAVTVTKLGDHEEVIVKRTVRTTMLPRDYLPMGAMEDDTDTFFMRDSRFVAAWVTPNDTAIEAFLTTAKAKLKKGRQFDGPQSETKPQVEALFEALRAKGVSYVMDPEVLSKDAKSQRTRLPADVLRSTNAQCLEGGILYATLMEAIGLSPSIVYVPGHAFVAWKPSVADKTKDKYFFLETTMTGGTLPFEKAVAAATATFAKSDAKHSTHVADIAPLRKLGVTPQPSQTAP